MTKQPKLTEAQAHVLNALYTFKEANDGCSPSAKELARMCNMHVSTVQYHLDRLHWANIIEKRGRRYIITGGRWLPPGHPLADL